MSILNLTSKQLRKAASIKDHIESLQNELNNVLGEGKTTPAKTAKPGRKMSKAVRLKMAVAAKLRWARKGITKPAPKKRRGMSAAGRARIAAAQKARWAKIKGAAKPASKIAVKPPKKARSKMSAAGRAKIAAAAKARWAKVKAAGKNKL